MKSLVQNIAAAIVAQFAILAPAAFADTAAQKQLMASIPASKSKAFKAYTGDTELGTHVMRWTVQGDTVIANVAIDLRARVLFLPVYSYEHRSQETWRNGDLVAIDTRTTDEGDKVSVKGELKDGKFQVASTKFNGAALLPLAPSSYWNYASLTKPNWLNTQSGAVLKIKIVPGAKEQVKTAKGMVEARRYEVTGDVPITLWYDASNVWVKSRFTVNGTTITYVLQ
jgi:hypothetical protein